MLSTHRAATFLLGVLLLDIIAPAVDADVLSRLQCYCREHNVHEDASFLQVVFYNPTIGTIQLDHECTKGYCVGISQHPLFHDSFCNTDATQLNTFCYHQHVLASDSFSFNGQDRTINVGQLRKDDCTAVCHDRFGLPVAGGFFAPVSRREVFIVENMDGFVRSEGKNRTAHAGFTEFPVRRGKGKGRKREN